MTAATENMIFRLLVILLASGLQFHQLAGDFRFHPDEALFMSFARRAAVQGDWMLSGPLDKPPLSMYISALSMAAVGTVSDDKGVLRLDTRKGEFAGRLPNALLAIALVALMMRLAWDFWRNERAARLAGLLMTASPYLLAFGATAFTDMSLLFWSTLSLWLAVRRRFGWAGLALGLAFWSKQQALWALPLIVMFIPRVNRQRWILGWLGVLGLLFAWDAARPETSVFLLGAAHNLPTSPLANPSTWLTRLSEWLRLGSWLIAPPLTALIIALAAAGRRKQRPAKTLLLYILAYLTLHTLIAFNQYDRYVLPILPAFVLLMASGLTRFIGQWRIAAVMIGLLMLSALSSLDNLPIGGDHSKYDGIDELAAVLNSKPLATVIYDPWLGWELDYYMGSWSDKRRVHYPTPDALAAGALALDEIGARYLVAPAWQTVDPWLKSLESVGFSVSADVQSPRFAVYRLLPPHPKTKTATF